jgi:hypothetical protein
VFSDNYPQYYLNILFQNPLTNGGIDPIVVGGYSYECDNCNSARYVSGGEVVGSLVDTPEPISLTLLGTGLVALTVIRNRKLAAALTQEGVAPDRAS